jgi:hypothetical protein
LNDAHVEREANKGVQFPQALIRRERNGQLYVALCSPSFDPLWQSKVLTLCEAFSADPPDGPLPSALFVQRLDRRHAVIVRTQASSQSRACVQCFHVLVEEFSAYASLHCDLFAIAEKSEPNWNAVHELPDFEWRSPTPERRTVADVQQVLKRDNGPELLGGCQALLDGSQLLFIRENADGMVIRDLWTLLPYGNRLELLPATFAWNNNLRFDVVVANAGKAANFQGYLTEEQAGGYPEGRYELSLQTAAEAEDQASLDILFTRRSRREMWRIGILLMAVLAILALAIKIMAPTPNP